MELNNVCIGFVSLREVICRDPKLMLQSLPIFSSLNVNLVINEKKNF